jgi:putative transposase
VEGYVPLWRLYYHVVWATKGREPLIGAEEETIIRRSLKLTFDDMDVIPHAVGIMPEHVHVVVSAPPKYAPAELVRRMKGASSRAIYERVDLRAQVTFAWQGEYSVYSLTERVLPTVIAYVNNQPAHHAAKTLWPGLERIIDDSRAATDTARRNPPRSTVSRLEPTSESEPGN